MTNPIVPKTTAPVPDAPSTEALTAVAKKADAEMAAANARALAPDFDIEAMVRANHDLFEQEIGFQAAWLGRTETYRQAMVRFVKRCIKDAQRHG